MFDVAVVSYPSGSYTLPDDLIKLIKAWHTKGGKRASTRREDIEEP